MNVDETSFKAIFGREPDPEQPANYVFAKVPKCDSTYIPEDEILVTFLPYEAARREAIRMAKGRGWSQSEIYLITAISLPR